MLACLTLTYLPHSKMLYIKQKNHNVTRDDHCFALPKNIVQKQLPAVFITENNNDK